ncbi:succinate dehydrogenase assembly factor 2 [Pasteurellaceae bacterium LIM206]|nr:succinate dehydrogenase assembly factor 2 [Pasteurellaceae bacterium LIM206]
MTTYDKLRLEWDCRRGMLELDKIIMPFYLQQFDSLSERQKAVFVRLLACTDLQLFSWLFKRARPEDAELQQMIEFIRQKQQIVIED